jgi:hypothetical protein
MPLDPNIIMGFKPTVDLEDPNKLRAEMQLNQLNQMKLQEAQQTMETKNAMRQLDPNSPTYGTDVMRLDPETGIKFGEYASKLESDKVNTRLNRFKAPREASGNLAFNPSDANVTAHIEDAILNKEITPEQATSSLEKVLGNPEKGIPPMSFAARKDYFLHLGLTADQQMKEITNTLDRDARAREGNLNRGVTLAGQRSTAATALAGQEKAPSGYRYTATGNLEAIPGGPAFMNPEGLTPKELGKREAAYPKTKAAFISATQNIDNLISDLTRLSRSEGLDAITGPIGSRTLDVFGPSVAARGLYEQISAKAMLNAMQQLRQSSPTGSALGNQSDKEGDRMIASEQNIPLAAGWNEVQKGIKNRIATLKQSKANIASAFDETYSYKTQAPASTTTSAQTPGVIDFSTLKKVR